jgi:hypothetical protein
VFLFQHRQHFSFFHAFKIKCCRFHWLRSIKHCLLQRFLHCLYLAELLSLSSKVSSEPERASVVSLSCLPDERFWSNHALDESTPRYPEGSESMRLFASEAMKARYLKHEMEQKHF